VITEMATSMSALDCAEANFFASLLNPSDVIATCERSTALNALARQKHSADRPGRKRSQELAAWDAVVEEGKSEAEWRRRNLLGAQPAQANDPELAEAVCA
jgi:hypothetical protein